MNLYEELGVSKDASADEIKKAYKVLAKKYHPDRKGGDVEKFKSISIAHSVLSDIDKRERYDKTGKVNREESIEEQAMSVVCQLFDTFLESAFSHGGPVKFCKEHLESQLGQSKIKLKSIENKISKISKAYDLVVSTSQDDLYSLVLNNKKGVLNNQIESIRNKVKIIIRSIEILSDYQDTPGERPEQEKYPRMVKSFMIDDPSRENIEEYIKSHNSNYKVWP